MWLIIAIKKKPTKFRICERRYYLYATDIEWIGYRAQDPTVSGHFPANYVTKGTRCTANHSYSSADSPDDLSFKKGDIIIATEIEDGKHY